MIKKHVYVPKWLDSILKASVEKGYFPNEAEVFRAGLLLALTAQRELSPEADIKTYDEIARNIDVARKKVEKYEIPSAIEDLRLASQILTYRVAISPITGADEEFFSSLRTVNNVLVDCLSYLGSFVKEDLRGKNLKEALEELEITNHLKFLAETYRGLARLKYQGSADKSIVTDQLKSDYLRESKK